ncbi:energy transducer TonB [Pedobacter nanyangensis]|uniref:energy transducer TonB n=1 Tax=Pedobacter nanyangensis TaxID=1562389 RepID=UPI000DE4B85C|nr:energy transducer TonB [Pedobacter nanyangensis]
MKKITLVVLAALLGYGLSPAQTNKSQGDQLYSFVALKNPPQFPGGLTKFYEFLAKNLKYPEAAKAKSIRGNVFASFIIEKDGSLSSIKILRGLGSGTDEEAIRVLKTSPKWKPGSLDGKPVRAQYSVPIKFFYK